MALRLSSSEQMNEGNRNLLISNMSFLQENLELSTLLPYMTPVLNDEDFAAIRNLTTRREQVEMLVTILPERGDKAFHCFIQNLRISQPHLADYMCKNPHIGETMLPREQFSTFHKGEQSKQQSERVREQSEQLKERGEQFEQPSESEREQSKQPCEPLGESKQPSERERGQSEQPKERKGEPFEQPSEREREQFKQPSEPRGESKQPNEPRGQSVKQPSDQEREQSTQPSKREREQFKQPNEPQGQSKQPSEQEREQSKQPSEREREQSKQSYEPRGQSKKPSEREREQSKQSNEPRGQSKQPSEQEREQSKQPNEARGQSKQPSERERAQQSKRPTERQGEQFEQLSERERELTKQPTERQGEQSEQRSEWEGENSKHASKEKRLDEACRLVAEAKEWVERESEQDTQLRIEKLEKTLEECKQVLEKGVPALHPQEKASKRMIFADLVTEKGSSWILKESGICIKFSPNAVQTPVMVTSSLLLRPGNVSPPLEDDETIVSNIIELACDDPVAIQFSKVTVTLSHSATELREYELVMKERINSEKNTWKDLETCCPLDPLGENFTPQSGLRFAQAKITSFSMYAVISRLKSYKFLVTKESPEFTCTVTEYPDVSVTVPTKYLPADEDFTFTLKIQQTPNDDYEKKGAYVSPILHISCPVEVALEEPALIRMPITLEERQIDLQNLSSSQIIVFHRCTRRKSEKWSEITRKLKTSPKLENGVVSFQVKRFSTYAAMVVGPGQLAGDRDGLIPLIPRPAVSQYAGFLACLCQYPEQNLLILCCFPCHQKSEVRKDVAEEYNVTFRGESTSDGPLNIDDQAFFHLPDTYTLLNEENTYLTFLGDEACQKSFSVLVESTKGTQSIRFFKFNNGRDEKETLCTVSMARKSPLQVPASKSPTLEGQPLKIAKNPKLWKTDASLRLLQPINEELGNCWMEIGIALNLSEAALRNIEEEYNSNIRKAYAVIWRWKEKEGTAVTMGHLIVALAEIGKNDIAHKLIEKLDKGEKEENKVQHAQRQENEDQPTGDSSSSITGAPESKGDDEIVITKRSELKDEQDQEKEEEKQAQGSEIVQKEITKLRDEVKQNNEVIKTLKTDLENAKEVTKELRVEELQVLQDEVKKQKETMRKLRSELKKEDDLQQKLKQDLKSR